MGMIRAGAQSRGSARTSVTAADTAYPSGSTQSGAIPVPANAKGEVTHLILDVTADSSPTAIADIYGYLNDEAQWYHLAQVKGGITMSPTNPSTTVGDSNKIHVAESFTHISFFDQLFVLFSTLTGTAVSASARFYFETVRQ